MHFSSEFEGSPLPVEADKTTIPLRPEWNEPAAPPLAAGVCAIMEQEHALQTLSDGFSEENHGADTPAVVRVLRNHHLRLGDNIALLRQHRGVLPRSAHGDAGCESLASLSNSSDPAMASAAGLRALATKHLKAVENIDNLIAQRPDGQRGEMILTEVARNHRAMAWMLNGLLSENALAHDPLAQPIIAGLKFSAHNWDDEDAADALLSGQTSCAA